MIEHDISVKKANDFEAKYNALKAELEQVRKAQVPFPKYGIRLPQAQKP